MTALEALELTANGDLSDIELDDSNDEDFGILNELNIEVNESGGTDVEESYINVQQQQEVKKNRNETIFTWKRSLK